MILQRLHDDCNIILRQTESEGEGMPPSGYVPKAVRWYVDIQPGVPVDVQRLGTDEKKNKGQIRLLPECKRSSGIRPFLLADTAAYVLGVNYDPKKTDAQANAPAKHEAFVKLARACADKTENPLAIAVAQLLEGEAVMFELIAKFPPELDAT
ncbi:MAG: hypothetical protein EON58_09410, partial [Alphaproteobacteria bacterium]